MLLLIIVLSILLAIPIPFTGAIPSMGITLLTLSYISGNAMLLFISNNNICNFNVITCIFT